MVVFIEMRCLGKFYNLELICLKLFSGTVLSGHEIFITMICYFIIHNYTHFGQEY